MKATTHADRFLRRLDRHQVRYSIAHQRTPYWALPMRELRWVELRIWFSIHDPKPTRLMFAPWGLVGRV